MEGRRDSRKGLVGVLGRAVVDDVKVEIAILVEVEPAGHERNGGRTDGLENRRDILKRFAVAIAEQAILAGPGQEDVDVAIGIEVARGDTDAGVIVGQAESSRSVFESTVSFIQEQDVMNSLWSDHGGNQEKVEPAVAIGVESRGGRTRSERGRGR